MKALRNLCSFLLLALAFSAMQAAAQTNTHAPTAIEDHGVLSLRIPYHGLHTGAGALSVEILESRGPRSGACGAGCGGGRRGGHVAAEPGGGDAHST